MKAPITPFIALLALAAPTLAGELPVPADAPQAQPFIDSAEAWLLGGQPLPPDYRHQLMAMEPDQRLRAIVWLRRSGMLVDRAWPIGDLMQPATRPQEEAGDEPGSRTR